MPHKHVRRAKANEAANHDLPPSSIAAPLATNTKSKNKDNDKQSPATAAASKSKRPRRKTKDAADDTPKAFARLMQYKTTGTMPKALDDGVRTSGSKKRKRGHEDAAAKLPSSTKASHAAAPSILPTILPGERLSDFSARVNQALPLAGLARKTVKIPGMKEHRTKIERKITKMQDLWREEDARRKDRAEEARDLEEEAEAEKWADGAATTSLALLDAAEADVGVAGKGTSGKRRGRGPADKGDADPWAVLKAAREQPRGLHDVVQAPPSFKKLPREVFKMRDGARVDVANVPKSAGSLRRREELGDTRKSIIEGYRAMMRGAAA